MSERSPVEAFGDPLSPEEEESLSDLISQLRSKWRIGQRVSKKRVDGPPPPPPKALTTCLPSRAIAGLCKSAERQSRRRT